MGFDTPATAEGDLGRTPLSHLLVYSIDQSLTGALLLTEPSGVAHVVRLVRGSPAKVRPGDGNAKLGELLVEGGLVSEVALADALVTRELLGDGLLGDVLLLAGCLDRDALERVADEQFLRRMVRLFALPPETIYRYWENHLELADYGAGPSCMDPLAVIWAGLCEHGDVSAKLDDTLARLGEAPLKLHAQSTITRLELGEAEQRVLTHLQECPEPLGALADRELVPRGALRRLVYALAITRQLDLGTTGVPVGAERAAPPSSTKVARMALRATAHRDGAAAPDLPGDGERAPMPSRGKSGRTSKEPPSRDDDARPTLQSPEPAPPAAKPDEPAPPVPAPEAPAPVVAKKRAGFLARLFRRGPRQV